jgi:methyltransferase (TIGR00027 family)
MALMDHLVAYGFALHVALRKQTIEAHARQALARGYTQLVVLGSGFDALAPRLAREFPWLQCFELDRPDTLALKRRALARAQVPEPGNLCFLACDLETTSLHDVLSREPRFHAHATTFYVAEGLTMYLSDQENRRLFSAIRACSAGQCTLAFTAIETLSTVSKLGGTIRDKLLMRNKARFSWCISSSEVETFLRGVGLRLQSVDTYQQLQSEFRSASERQRLERVSGEHVYLARDAEHSKLSPTAELPTPGARATL